MSKLFCRDNFWNIVFFVGVIGAFAVGNIHKSIFIMVLALTIVPFLLTRFNKVKYLGTKDGFINSQGEPINDRLPKFFIVVFTISFVFTCFVFAPFAYDHPIANLVLTTTLILFSLPTVLYFIIKCCPIAIIYNAYGFLFFFGQYLGKNDSTNKSPHSSSGLSQSYADTFKVSNIHHR